MILYLMKWRFYPEGRSAVLFIGPALVWTLPVCLLPAASLLLGSTFFFL